MAPTRRHITAFLQRLRLAIDEERIFVDAYALDRAAEDFEWDHLTILDELRWLTWEAFHKIDVAGNPRFRGEDIWVFCPRIVVPPDFRELILWIRIVERSNFVIISFHEA